MIVDINTSNHSSPIIDKYNKKGLTSLATVPVDALSSLLFDLFPALPRPRGRKDASETRGFGGALGSLGASETRDRRDPLLGRRMW